MARLAVSQPIPPSEPAKDISSTGVFCLFSDNITNMNKKQNNSDLDRIRDEIDQIDEQIIKLVSDRSRCVDEIVKHNDDPTSIRDSKREEQVLSKNKILAEKFGVSNELIASLYRIMFDYFVNKHK